jgi:chromosomal replication initiator protein
LNAKQIWQATLADLEAQISRGSFETWIRHVSAVSFNRGVFVVAAPSSYARDWIETRMLGDIRQSLTRVVGRPVQVEVTVRQTDAEQPEQPLADQVAEPIAKPARERAPRPASRRAVTRTAEDEPTPATAEGAATSAPLADGSWRPSPRYTFDTFVVGPSNQLPCAAAQAVAARPGEAYNPLFIYGGVGLGKTHLMHAIAHEAIRQGLTVTYVSSETFTNELIAGIRDRRTDEFRGRYRGTDVLLIDDVQFIAGKEATQEEFFHTFNALHTSGKQVVLSSDRPPRAIPTLEDRLRSRFEWGLIADVQPPDLETRTAILQRRVREQGAIVPPEVLTYVAQRIQSNIRELEGSLTRVIAYAQLTKRPQNKESAAAALSDVVANPVRRYIGSEHVIDAVCRYYQADGRALRGKGRSREIVLPRQVAMYLLREETGASTLEIGRELGGRDHSTVLHGSNKIQGDIESDAQLRKDVLAIRDLIYAEARP